MNAMMDWPNVLEVLVHAPAATSDDLARLQDDLTRPLSIDEIDAIVSAESNPWPVAHPFHAEWQPRNPRDWSLPSVPLPSSYLDFLRWSDGPLIRQGQREFGFFPSAQVREFLLGYRFPCHMPGAIPIGLDGGGIFAVLDTRQGAATEYPVLATAAGVLDFAESAVLGTSFEAFCTGRTRVPDVLYPPPPEAATRSRPVDVVLVRRPESLALLMAIRQHLELDLPAARWLGMSRDLPRALLSQVPFWRYRRCIEGLPPDALACIQVVDAAPGTLSE